MSRDRLQFLKNQPLYQIPPRFEPILFNTQGYHRLQEYQQLRAYGLSDGRALLAQVFFVGKGQLMSLPAAPYASMDFSNQLSLGELNQFFKQVLDSLEQERFENAIIRAQPTFFHHNTSLDEVLSLSGCSLEYQDINHHVPIVGDYLNLIDNMQQRRFRKVQQEGFTWQEESTEKLEEIHSFISKCRLQQGIEINIDYRALEEAFYQLPGYYRAFTVRLGGKLVAATITVKVRSDVVYHYLPASDKDFHAYSPLVFLMVNLVDLLYREGYQYLDLGISSIKGVPQEGLIQFKERMGGLKTGRGVWKMRLA